MELQTCLRPPLLLLLTVALSGGLGTPDCGAPRAIYEPGVFDAAQPLLTTAASSPQALAATYYVDINHPQADDSNPGTPDLPWRHCPGMPGWTGSTELAAGDVVYFHNEGTWAFASGDAVLQVLGGVTYDGSTWGSGSRATFRATGPLNRSVINFMTDHPTQPTVVRGLEVDANNQLTSGVGINWPQSTGSMTGATKRIEDCIVHDVYSQSSQGQYEYGIVISSGWGGSRGVSNVEVLNCVTYNISRGGINVYAANDDPSSWISNVLVRGNEIYQTGTDPDYAGSGLALKNHIINVVLEYNSIHNPVRGIGIGISTHPEPGFIGPESTVIRHNIIKEAEHCGIFFQGAGDKSVDIYGNLIMNNRYEGIRLALSLEDSLAVRIHNNTFYHNYPSDWSHELRIESNAADVTLLEVRNNLFYAATTTRCLGDDDGDITLHSNNIYFREGGGTLVTASGASYTAANITSWEPSALTGDPLLKDPTDQPTRFLGTYGVDMQPDRDGLNITAGSEARDYGAALGSPYGSSVNSVTRPSGAGWDVGAYEFVPSLVLHGAPADQTIYLNWEVDVTLPPTSTWQIDYEGPVGDQTPPISGISNSIRAYTLTGLTNYVWYTVTLSTAGVSPTLSDTVQVMPTDWSVYLPLVVCRY